MSPVFRVAPSSKLYILLDCEIGLAKEVCVCVCVFMGVCLSTVRLLLEVLVIHFKNLVVKNFKKGGIIAGWAPWDCWGLS